MVSDLGRWSFRLIVLAQALPRYRNGLENICTSIDTNGVFSSLAHSFFLMKSTEDGDEEMESLREALCAALADNTKLRKELEVERGAQERILDPATWIDYESCEESAQTVVQAQFPLGFILTTIKREFGVQRDDNDIISLLLSTGYVAIRF